MAKIFTYEYMNSRIARHPLIMWVNVNDVTEIMLQEEDVWILR